MQALTLKRDDTELPAEAFTPDLPGPRPGVVIGPGGLARGDASAYRWAGERLASAGFHALVITYSAASPRSDTADLALGLDWLSQEPSVDTARLAVFGHSRGALSSLALATIDARVRAVVAIATPVDLARYVNGLSGFAPTAAAGVAQFFGGQPHEVPELYAAFEAERLGREVHQPVLLIHGTADMRVPIEYAEALKTGLLQGGNSQIKLELIPGMGHSLELGTSGYQFDRVIDLATSWLKELWPEG